MVQQVAAYELVTVRNSDETTHSYDEKQDSLSEVNGKEEVTAAAQEGWHNMDIVYNCCLDAAEAKPQFA